MIERENTQYELWTPSCGIALGENGCRKKIGGLQAQKGLAYDQK